MARLLGQMRGHMTASDKGDVDRHYMLDRIDRCLELLKPGLAHEVRKAVHREMGRRDEG